MSSSTSFSSTNDNEEEVLQLKSRVVRLILLHDKRKEPATSDNHLGSYEVSIIRAQNDQKEGLKPGIQVEGWIACLIELGISTDHLTWVKAALEVELPDFPNPYSLFILLCFNEEEYMNQPAEEDEAVASEVDPASDDDGPGDVAAVKTKGDGGSEHEGRTGVPIWTFPPTC
ncbi:hypothetical protein Acr_00g0092760 [Actinidia rufa]|uniref:Uncharacterized protein n=1 Tax=Actinidia rufa TaxID=165716 RepID=A0A7J0DXP1_9ERIC|nr:hypothetical protein Acr_00g0092760 [Actinidia rufa]